MAIKQSIPANRKTVILIDLCFVVSMALLWYATNSFHKSNVVVSLMLIFAFATCIRSHAEYYRLTKRIY